MATVKQLTAAALLIFFAPLLAGAMDPAEILERMESVMRGDSSYGEMVMRIERPRYEREVSMRYWLKGRDYSLILITAPARDRGTAYLMRKNDIWNYDPRIDRTTRLPSSMMSQSWMGSDFTNDDLVRDTNLITDYDHELRRTESHEGRQAYVLELTPKPDTPVVWGKVVMWVCTDDFIQLRVENYDQRGDRVNTMVLDRIRTFGDREIPSRITVTPEGKKDERTVLTYDTLTLDIDIDDGFFTRANLQRLR